MRRKKRTRYIPLAFARAAERGIELRPDDWEMIWSLLEESPEPSYVYAIVDYTGGLVKFGRSVRPAQRCRALQTACGRKLKLWAFCREESDFNESSVHKHMAEHRRLGEWFLLNNETRAMIGIIRGRPAGAIP